MQQMKRVLHAESEQELTSISSDMLRKKGIEVVAVGNAEDAIKALNGGENFEQYGGINGFDGFIFNVHYSTGSTRTTGTDLAKMVREHDKEKIIAVTSGTPKFVEDALLQLTEYDNINGLNKPYRAAELYKALDLQ